MYIHIYTYVFTYFAPGMEVGKPFALSLSVSLAAHGCVNSLFVTQKRIHSAYIFSGVPNNEDSA